MAGELHKVGVIMAAGVAWLVVSGVAARLEEEYDYFVGPVIGEVCEYPPFSQECKDEICNGLFMDNAPSLSPSCCNEVWKDGSMCYEALVKAELHNHGNNNNNNNNNNNEDQITKAIKNRDLMWSTCVAASPSYF